MNSYVGMTMVKKEQGQANGLYNVPSGNLTCIFVVFLELASL